MGTRFYTVRLVSSSYIHWTTSDHQIILTRKFAQCIWHTINFIIGHKCKSQGTKYVQKEVNNENLLDFSL